MKKKLLMKRLKNACIPGRKIFLIMRLTLFLFCLSLFNAFASNGYGQDAGISLDLKNSSVNEILNKIEEQTEYFFLYNNKLIDVDRRISVRCEGRTVDSVLKQIFEGTDVDFVIKDRMIVLTNQLFTEIKIAGKVTDSKGLPLPGVTIVVKGSTNGTITNTDGEYSIAGVPSDGTLQFSFVGMATQEIEVNNQLVINITMEEEAYGIEEVIAVGYGTMRKQDVTGAVSEAKIDLYENVPVTNILETVKGSVAGLNVGGTNTAGAVGSLTIRGQNTPSASNNPLLVVDGAIFNGSLADIPTNDIENLTVLKDASAAAVYGSRSANGVIIIGTKRGLGINGKPKFDVKLSYGISNQLKPLSVYNGKEYLQRMLEIRAANSIEAEPDDIRLYLTEEELKNYDATADHRPTLEDPFSLISQMGNTLNTTFSVSSSTEKTNYYISTSLIRQKGVVVFDDYKHISGRVNISSDLTDWFNLGINSFYSLRDYSGDSPSMSRATHFSPYASVYNEDGSYKQFPQTTTSFNSPFWEIATEDTDIQNNLTGIVTGIVKIPWVQGLSYHATYSNSVRWNERNEFFNEYTIDGKGKNGIGNRYYERMYNMLLDNVLKYNNTFAEKHKVDVTLLFSREHYTWENMKAYAEDFDNTTLGTYALENGNIQTVNTGGGETDAIGMMARATYTYNQRYSLTGTVRRDGFSAFSVNKKWGVFPSLGFNWKISEETFMENVSSFNNLALRVSYGKNGNQSINPYSTLAKIATDKYIFYGSDSYTVTQYISSLANNDLSWESTTGLNLGIDFAILNRRINGAVDVYKTKTNDLMFDLSLPTASGMSKITSNIGEIKNKGIEITLNTLNIDKSDFKWYSDIAFSLNRNEVASILGEDNDGDGKEDDLISDGYFIGRSLGTIYDYRVIGMWQQDAEDNGTIMSGMRPGDYKLYDVDGDGAITSDKDRQFIGNTNPNFRWSWTNTLKYKDLSLMVYLYSVWGGNGWFLSKNNTPYNDGYANSTNINHAVYDYWTPENTGAKFPRPDYASHAAYKGKEFIDRSFIKLQKVSLTYDVSRFVAPWGMKGLSFSLSADNIFTYAPHWEGLDPETDSGLTDSSVPSIRTWLFSVSLNF